jgi:cytochrome c oxidase subunit 4
MATRVDDIETGAAPHWDGHGVAHTTPLRVLVVVWLSLVVLTVLTVAATSVDFGAFNLWLAMGIATLKGSLVVLYFMHMRYDRPFNAIVFGAALLFVMLFVSITLLDTTHYEPDMIPGYAPAIQR